MVSHPKYSHFYIGAGRNFYLLFVDHKFIMQRHAGSDHYRDLKEDLWIATFVGKSTDSTEKEMRLRENGVGTRVETRVEALRNLYEELGREEDEESRKEFVRTDARFFVAESRAEYEVVMRCGTAE